MLQGFVPFPPEFAARYRDKGYWRDQSLAQEFDAVFQRFADRVALIDGEQQFTYAELDRDDPVRSTIAETAFLRASLFTSVIAFGVAGLTAGLGVLFVVVGTALRRLGRCHPLGGPAGGVAPPLRVVSCQPSNRSAPRATPPAPTCTR